MSGFRDYQSVIQAGVRRGDATRRAPLDRGGVRALFGRMVSQVWTPAEIGLLDHAACSAMLERPGSAMAGDREMNQTCDRCRPAVRAGYRIDRVNTAGELYLCGPCASRHWRALSAQGWTCWPLGVHALAPQASEPSPAGPVQDAA